MHQKKRTSLIYILPFLCLIFVIPIYSLIDEDAENSASENRALQQKPTKADLMDWTFTTKYESYINDQLPKRDALIKGYTQYEMGIGKHLIRNLYLTPTNQLILVPSNLDDNAIRVAAKKTNDFSKIAEAKGKTVFFAITPRKNTALREMLVDVFQKNELEKVALFVSELGLPDEQIIDVGSGLREGFSIEERDNFFFKTDFHWNANGAMNGFKLIYNQMNQVLSLTPEDFDIQQFEQVSLPNAKFLGDLNRRLQNQIDFQEQVIYYGLPNEKNLTSHLLVKEKLNKVDVRSIYASKADQPEVNYNDIFTNNLGYYKITNSKALTNEKIIIFKDSYQNATLPFFVQYFAQVEVVDQRYLGEQDCLEVLEESSANTVLIMYNDGNIWGPMFEFNKQND